MTITAEIGTDSQDVLASIRGFFEDVLSLEDVGAVLVPCHLPRQKTVMPMLVTEPAQLAGIDPLAPSFPLNGARVLSRLLRKPMGTRVAALMRPCEIRAFLELVKLNQARTEEVILIGMDCLGAFGNRDYADFAGDDPLDSALQFCRQRLAGKDGDGQTPELAPACRVCEFPIPEAADVLIGLYGGEGQGPLPAQSCSQKGEELLAAMNLPAGQMDESRASVIDLLKKARLAARDRLFARTAGAIDSLEKMSSYFSRCINCYNCRVACPVCYCKECVFVTDVFYHEPDQYLRWARRRGTLKMPTDTVFYHITRLAHMSTACVGCGQCSNACPNDIPVMEVFRTVAHRTQEAFGYQAGRSLAENPPLSEFREQEFEEVVGIEP
jgi:formate dehydrogenase subunit beta